MSGWAVEYTRDAARDLQNLDRSQQMVVVRAEKGKITIVPVHRHKSLEERVAECPEPYRADEDAWGSAAGKEAW